MNVESCTLCLLSRHIARCFALALSFMLFDFLQSSLYFSYSTQLWSLTFEYLRNGYHGREGWAQLSLIVFRFVCSHKVKYDGKIINHLAFCCYGTHITHSRAFAHLKFAIYWTMLAEEIAHAYTADEMDCKQKRM